MTDIPARVAHVGIAVPSIAHALAFYQDTLGLEPGRPEAADGATTVGHTLGDVQIELLQPRAPASLVAHEADTQRDVAPVGALQPDAAARLVLLPRHRQLALDDTLAGMVQIALDDRDPLIELFGLHPVGGGSALRAPQGAHALRVVRLHGREELSERLVERLGCGRSAPAASAREGAQRDEHGQSWFHGGSWGWTK